MSHLARAMISRQFLDKECIEKAIGILGFEVKKEGNIYSLCCGFSLSQTAKGFEIVYESGNIKHLSLLQKFPEIYDRAVKEKIEHLKKEEDSALASFASEEEKKTQEIRLRRERMALEQKMREEKAAIQKKGDAILEAAKKLGYTVKTETKNGERILVCVRRK